MAPMTLGSRSLDFLATTGASSSGGASVFAPALATPALAVPAFVTAPLVMAPLALGLLAPCAVVTGLVTPGFEIPSLAGLPLLVPLADLFGAVEVPCPGFLEEGPAVAIRIPQFVGITHKIGHLPF
jgi:hypothetical protein